MGIPQSERNGFMRELHLSKALIFLQIIFYFVLNLVFNLICFQFEKLLPGALPIHNTAQQSVQKKQEHIMNTIAVFMIMNTVPHTHQKHAAIKLLSVLKQRILYNIYSTSLLHNVWLST